MPLSISGINFFILSILVILIGGRINHEISFLEKSNIPKAVTGGLLFSALFGIAESYQWFRVDFDMAFRNLLLLVFFASVGLSAKVNELITGGRSLILFLIPAVMLLVIQNAVGVSICYLFGDEPVHGLFAGSIPLSGGHGTAIAWGQEATRQGFLYAESIGISFATFGLVLGGLVGCPLSTWLIYRYQLQPNDHLVDKAWTKEHGSDIQGLFAVDALLKVLLMVFVAISLGGYLNKFLASFGVLLPNFVVVMLIAIMITNVLDVFNRGVNDQAINMTNRVSLEVFLAMSLMAIKFSSFSYHLVQMLVLMVVQVALIIVFTVFVVFRLLGKNYDAAIISSGLVGLGLGATPVAIGNMLSLTEKFGPSSKALLIVPLFGVGVFFIDLAHTIVLKLFLSFLPNGF